VVILVGVQVTPQTANSPHNAAFVRDLGGFLKYLLAYGQGDFYEAVAELDLSLTQVRIMHLLCRDTDEASLKWIAEETGHSMPTVSRAVDSLVQRGLLTRVENPEDRRAKSIRATGDALAVAARLVDLRLAGLEEFAQSLSPAERDALAAALEPIVAREDIAPLCGSGAPGPTSQTTEQAPRPAAA
jgi:DNA-binding MarR family transcriptional regulator